MRHIPTPQQKEAAIAFAKGKHTPEQMITLLMTEEDGQLNFSRAAHITNKILITILAAKTKKLKRK